MKVYLLAAITADGFIGKSSSHLSTRWTSKEDTKFFRSFSKEVTNLVVGSKTFLTFNRKIEDRKFYVYSRQGIIDNKFENDMEVTTESPKELVTRLEKEGVESLLIAGGSSIYTQFMKARVVDELYLTIESIIFGNGVKLLNEEFELKLNLLEVIDLSDQTKVLHYSTSIK